VKIYGYVVARDDEALTIVDLSDPTAPAFKGSLQGAGSPNYLDYPTDIVVRYPYAYTVDNSYYDGLSIFDIRNPSAISRVGGLLGSVSANYLSRCFRIVLEGNYAYVTGSDGLTIVNISDVTAPRTVGNLAAWAFAYHLVKDGDTCYLTVGDRISAVDVSDLTAPAELVLYPYPGSGAGAPNYLNNPRGIYKDGNVIYICAEVDDALTAWSWNPPADPVQLGVIRGAGSPNFLNTAQLVIVRNKLAYVATQGDHGLTIIDVSDPTTMSYKGGVYSTSYMWEPWGMKLRKNYAYLCGRVYGVTAVDISDPEAPTVEGNIQGAGSPNYLDGCYGIDIHAFPERGNPNLDQLLYRHVERMGR